jgi:hypothetical protein
MSCAVSFPHPLLVVVVIVLVVVGAAAAAIVKACDCLEFALEMNTSA